MKLSGYMRMFWIGLSFAAFFSLPAQAQTCPPTECFLSVSCTSCSVGQTILFDTQCSIWIKEPFCEEEPAPGEPPCEAVCEESTFQPSTVYYQGERKVNGVWVEDAACVSGDNPLTYTFVSGDVGLYRRQTCLDSNCNNCTALKTISVSP